MNQTPRLPTRVSTACDRCRRRKQRCDDARPCSMCLRVNAECTANWRPPTKRKRSSPPASGSSLETTVPGPNCDTMTYPSRQNTHERASRVGENSSDRPLSSSRSAEATWSPLPGSIYDSANDFAGSAALGDSRTPAAVSDFGEGNSALAITRKIFDHQNSAAFGSRATFAIPGGDYSGTSNPKYESSRLVPISSIIGVDLPPRQICDSLLEIYFLKVHWFSLVVHEPRFRARYIKIIDTRLAYNTDRGFLLLLIMLFILGSWYRSRQDTPQEGPADGQENMRNGFLKLVRDQFMDLMDEDSLEFVQLCALLGSFYLYHGRPRSSFSILGAATKTAQAIGLHRELEGQSTFEEVEERKRVWWTIYTWDRFATIIYGRPLGINDRDCNVSMPRAFIENINFDRTVGPMGIYLSTYQTQLNMIYQIASPVLENLYGIRTSNDIQTRLQLSRTISAVNQSLQRWQRELPIHLAYDEIEDITDTSSTEEKLHKLQALALKLTYENLVIIVNRLLLANRRNNIPPPQGGAEVHDGNSMNEPRDIHSARDTEHAAFKRCLVAALSISKVPSKKQLVQLAGQTHLVSFLGINLFTASVVMFICAISDILSNVAQEAKRGIARTLRLQKSLSPQASLSMQCSMILEDLVKLVLDREREAILPSAHTDMDSNVQSSSLGSEGNVFNLNDTLEATGFPRAGLVEEPVSTFSDATWTDNNVDLSVEDVQFRHSLLSLQRVFQDYYADTPHASIGNIVSENREAEQYTMQEPGQFPEGGLEGTGMSYANARIEDLGQFWLWDFGR